MENTSFSELAKKWISFGIRAPSGHNSQPWNFEVGENIIHILPNLSRHLEIVDSTDRELFVSLGCALENLQIAALQDGYTSDYDYKDEKIVITFKKLDSAIENKSENDTLFNAINKRHTHRGKFTGEKISEEKLQSIKKCAEAKSNDNVDVKIYDLGSEEAKIVCQKISEGNDIQMSDPAFRNELIEWMRFNNGHIEETHNGLCYNVLGFPPTPVAIGRIVIKMFLKPNAQNKTDNEINASSSQFCVFTVKENNIPNYIALGKYIERILLTVSSLGLAYSFSNQPCEVAKLNEEIRNELKLTDYPSVIIRLGSSDGKEPKNFSPRETPEIKTIE